MELVRKAKEIIKGRGIGFTLLNQFKLRFAHLSDMIGEAGITMSPFIKTHGGGYVVFSKKGTHIKLDLPTSKDDEDIILWLYDNFIGEDLAKGTGDEKIPEKDPWDEPRVLEPLYGQYGGQPVLSTGKCDGGHFGGFLINEGRLGQFMTFTKSYYRPIDRIIEMDACDAIKFSEKANVPVRRMEWNEGFSVEVVDGEIVDSTDGRTFVMDVEDLTSSDWTVA